jgi:DNA polymerase-3 subunit delta'
MKTLTPPYPWLAPLAARLQTQVDHPPQALCLVGVPGLGQASLADAFARAILACEHLSQHPDYLFIAPEPGKSIGIDQVRDMSAFCLIPPTYAPRKLVMIHALESMTLAAQQAFLKTLEEPVIPTTFIILCSQPNKLLPTVRSRCQLMALPTVPYADAKSWLAHQQIETTEALYALSDGAPLSMGTPAFESRAEAYRCLRTYLSKKSDFVDAAKPFLKADPFEVLTGFYYALVHEKQFALLDRCIALRQDYAENPNLHWEMQLTRFFIEAADHAR